MLYRLLPQLFNGVDHFQHDPVLAQAQKQTLSLLDPITQPWSDLTRPVIHGLAPPFTSEPPAPPCQSTEAALSRLVGILTSCLNKSQSKHLTAGCCACLCKLSQAYPVPEYARAWGCSVSSVKSQPAKAAGRQNSSGANPTYV